MNSKNRQSGMTLIELMVGIAIGLMAVVTALGALIVARNLAGTTNEASTLQQQAAYITRVLGTQLRQAGALQMALKFNAPDTEIPTAFDKVAFLTGSSTDPSLQGGQSTTTPPTEELTTRYRNYQESLIKSLGATPGSVATEIRKTFTDCTGASSSDVVSNAFSFQKNTDGKNSNLYCTGGSGKQPIASNVLSFSTRYIYQSSVANGVPKYQTLTGEQVNTQPGATPQDRWANVIAANVCFVLSGTEGIDTGDGEYTDCNGEKQTMGNRLVMVFRNSYQIRSQGAPV